MMSLMMRFSMVILNRSWVHSMFWRVLLCLSIMAVMIGPMSFSTYALADETEQQPHAVGMRQFHWVDKARENWAGDGPRPLVAYLWYPTTEDAEQKLVAFPPDEPIFIGGKAARNAPFLNDDQTRPLVLMSHGTGGLWFTDDVARATIGSSGLFRCGCESPREYRRRARIRCPWFSIILGTCHRSDGVARSTPG